MLRLVLPEHGLCAIVEFGERQMARNAFKKLAYRKFKNVPIYLEWAPVDVFEGDGEERERIEKEEEERKQKELVKADLDYIKADEKKSKYKRKIRLENNPFLRALTNKQFKIFLQMKNSS